MDLTSRQVQLIQDTLKLIVPSAESFTNLFYNRLFELEPAIRALFCDDIKAHALKFITTLALVVNSLDRPEQILPAVRYLGQRHVGYGVQPEDYQLVRQALLWALAQKLGDTFTKEVEEAWLAAYHFITDKMQEAAIEVTAHSGLS